MIPRYVSGFADDIKAMMEWRNTLGYKKESYSYCLKDFDRFCSQKYPEAAVLTWDIWRLVAYNWHKNGAKMAQKWQIYADDMEMKI